MSSVARGSPWREFARLPPMKYSPPTASTALATASATSTASMLAASDGIVGHTAEKAPGHLATVQPHG